jgi:hypothetical protein
VYEQCSLADHINLVITFRLLWLHFVSNWAGKIGEFKMKELAENYPQGTANIADDRVLATVFDFNERVVWDSGFDYEIGHFLGEGNSYDTWLIDVRTGLIVEPCSHSKSEVFKYTTELINKLTAKYSYEKRFSELF